MRFDNLYNVRLTYRKVTKMLALTLLNTRKNNAYLFQRLFLFVFSYRETQWRNSGKISGVAKITQNAQIRFHFIIKQLN